MSAGPRLSLDQADKVAAALFELWKLDPRSSFVVGSVRRRRPDVGDLELVAPHDAAAWDTLHDRIKATMHHDVAGLLFCNPTPRKEPIGRAVRGLKPGFLAASLMLRPFDHDIPCQIYRYTSQNFGWVMLCRTGPAEFGAWFLSRWKSQWRIPVGDPRHTITAQDRFALSAVVLDSRDLLGSLRVGRFLCRHVGVVDPYAIAPKSAADLRRKLRLCRKPGRAFRPDWLRIGRRAMPVASLTVDGDVRLVSDLLLRMLRARELFLCQGFPASYVLTGTARSQVARCGNSVPPDLADAVIGANVGGGA